MNERIKQLAVEAGIISAEYNGFDSTSLATSQKKFAELNVLRLLLMKHHLTNLLVTYPKQSNNISELKNENDLWSIRLTLEMAVWP